MEPIKTILNNVYRALIRTLAFTSKDLRNIFHQPRLIFSLILGPFLILLVFGLGYDQSARELDTLFVVPEGSEIAQRLQLNRENLPSNINYVDMISDADKADTMLREGEVDLVIVAPSEPLEKWRQNSQAKFTFYHNEIDPVESSYIRVVGNRSIDELNQILLIEVANRAKVEAEGYQKNVQAAHEQAATVRRRLEQNDGDGARQALKSLQENVDLLSAAAGTGMVLLDNMESVTAGEQTSLFTQLETIQQNLDMLSQMDPSQSDFSDEIAVASQIEADLGSLDELLAEFQEIDSQVLVEPFIDETLSITNTALDPTDFYVPAVISLLLQHIAITMAGLSIVREQKEGALELFQAAPVSSFETLLGKYLGFLLLIGLLAAVLTGLIVWGLGTPMLGRWGLYSLTLLTLLIVSLGIGFHISISARSDSQAIQYSMIFLLASIFFTGFFLPLYRLQFLAKFIAWLLPATYSTLLLKDIMLRGQIGSLLLQGALILAAVLIFLLAWWRLARRMQQE